MRISDWSSDVCSSDLPTLVLHGSRDQIAPLSQGRALAAGIPGATFVQLETENHVLLEDEPAWGAFREAVLEFTGLARTDGATRALPLDGLTKRERAVLGLLCEGRSNAQIAWPLGVAGKKARTNEDRKSTSLKSSPECAS